MQNMKFVSIDLETTGLDPKTCEIVEFGAVLDEVGNQTPVEQLPRFHAYIDRPLFSGEPYALSMHPTIFRRIATKEDGFRYVAPDKLGTQFAEFLIQHGYRADSNYRYHIICAGKNFASFDYRFLLNLPGFEERIKMAHRSLDPVMLYFDPLKMDKLPGLTKCMQLAGLEGEVKHTAVEDALDVIRLLRFKWSENWLTELVR